MILPRGIGMAKVRTLLRAQFGVTSLRGRALAGAQGNTAARIFCRDFHAELVAIAGHYKVLDDVPDNLLGKAVQVWLEQDQIKIAALD